MNTNEKNQIVELLNTIKSALEYAFKNRNEELTYVDDSYEGLKAICKFLALKKYDFIANKVKNVIDKIEVFRDLSEEGKKVFFRDSVNEVENIITEIKQYRKIKALFLPYKVSMWTSLESIWEAADNDEMCEVAVVPIPYHELDEEKNKVKICYEGDLYDKNIPIRRFWEYDLEKEKPDVIFIHNPYDDTNTLTRVDDEYYSRNLKKHTDMLVYIPYHTQYIYNAIPKIPQPNYIATRYVDKIIVECEGIKDEYESLEHNLGKVLALGSPKFDAIYKTNNGEKNIPLEWKNKIKDKKVFLLNTTLTFFTSEKEKAVEIVLNIYNSIVKRENCFLIWRPHPLEEAWIKKTMPGFLEGYEKIKKLFTDTKNTLIDLSPDYRAAFSISSALFSTNSSLITEYHGTGKSIYALHNRWKEYNKYVVDNTYDYYMNEKKIEDFIDDVVSGKEDKLFDERINCFYKCIPNSKDGSCGEKIYKTIKKEVLQKKM